MALAMPRLRWLLFAAVWLAVAAGVGASTAKAESAADTTQLVEAAAKQEGVPEATGAATEVTDTPSGVSVGGSDFSGVRMAVPGADVFEQTSDSVVAETTDDSNVVLQQVGAGGVRGSLAIEGPDAPERYAFEFQGASELRVTETGEVEVIAQDGTLDSMIGAAWARDAAGRSVPTHYEIQGTTLIQVVDHHGGGFEYVITADPWWVPVVVAVGRCQAHRYCRKLMNKNFWKGVKWAVEHLF